jgi:hypothetical protein
MGKPQVTLTFAGDHKQLEQSFDKVGAAAKGMGSDVGSASREVGNSGRSFDRAGEAADNMDTKAMGFRDTMTGVEDTSRGVGMIMKGDLFDGFLMLGMGIGDLGSGLYNFLIPALKNASFSMIGTAASTVQSTVAAGAHKVATMAGAVATGAMTVAQRGLNLAMRANPIGLVITALFAVGAALVLAWQKSATFRAVVQGAMRGVVAAFGWILSAGGNVIGWFRDLPGKIGGFFSGIGSTISAPFVAAFRAIKSWWNRNIGGKGFDVPSWVPGVGGRSFRLPRLHGGGVVPGAPGQEQLTLLQAGERVSSASSSGPRVVLELRSSGSRLDDMLLEVLRQAIRVKGGNVQVVLGGL